MGRQYRYRPQGNRTPVNDPVLGHLCFEGVYDDPRCANDPRFEEIKPKDEPRPSKQTTTDTPPAQPPADAGKPGRSA